MTPDLNQLEPNCFYYPSDHNFLVNSRFISQPQKPTQDVTHNHKHSDVTLIHHVLHYTPYCPSAMTRSCYGVDVN